jgi:hypothetical protein
MTDQESAARLRATLLAIGGGFLRNPVRLSRVTCADCATPVAGYELCFACKDHRAHSGLADIVAFLTYAVAGQKSGHVMRGYKARPPIAEHRMVVGLLLILALYGHTECVSALMRLSVTHWAIVPSLPARPQEHPLRSLVAGHAPGVEAPLVASAAVQDPRAVNPDHFGCTISLPQASHVLLVDDTWARGGHAQSAALALRRAGAAKVSVLVVARWIKEDYGDNKKFMTEFADRDYDPKICPWTGGRCP